MHRDLPRDRTIGLAGAKVPSYNTVAMPKSMKTIHLRSRVGIDGMLHLDVLVGKSSAELDVVVVVSAAPGSDSANGGPIWPEFIASTAGSIPDPKFVRHAEGEYEMRDTLA
jgi:hypothetical protein